MEKYVIEYSFNSSPKVLFNRLSTASGLTEWFADDVKLRGKIFTFVWDGSEQEAELLGRKDLKYVRFHWIDDEDEETYFEFKMNVDELTGDVALIITDFAEEGEEQDGIELWNQQVSELKHILGI